MRYLSNVCSVLFVLSDRNSYELIFVINCLNSVLLVLGEEIPPFFMNFTNGKPISLGHRAIITKAQESFSSHMKQVPVRKGSVTVE